MMNAKEDHPLISMLFDLLELLIVSATFFAILYFCSGCRHDNRRQETQVQVSTIVCTQDTVEVDCDRPLEVVDDQGDSHVVGKGHTSLARAVGRKYYSLIDGEVTVGRCGD